MDTEEDVSPSQIVEHLDCGDDPNIRTALTAMQERPVAELVSEVKRSDGELVRGSAAAKSEWV